MTTTPSTRKAPVKKVAATPAKKAAVNATTPTKAKAASKATTSAPAKAAVKTTPEKRVYTATARSGQVVLRTKKQAMTHAIDVAEPDASSAKAKAGRIWEVYPSQEKAEAAAAKLRASGYDVVVTTAKAVTE